MEQRIDPKTQPAYAAGTDPAYIPGLTAPRTAAKADEDPERTEEPAPEGSAPEDAVVEAAPEEDAAPDAEPVAGTAADDEEDEKEHLDEADGASSDDGPDDGPSFEVSDRRGSISADRAGIRFTLDDQEADFRWDEIGAVELKPARFGRRFTITVHMSTRRWFNAEVEAAARSSLKEWTDGFDAVLDAYFEES
ncbi:hypothetical protein [Streptomyces sp. NBC_00385]|uniref:hypothetical protein n=1 Tax=Streptomyces sp. NBC_00385 TaxID=2975733 RepID=UPI002DD9017A|nr:hypothetical protein [Streptomyces sp. NBC_00385]WRZ03098.1 hypothetical protein OG959_06975 [Streptomyces sp. NBC_00385]